jgi:hypothetical protein
VWDGELAIRVRYWTVERWRALLEEFVDWRKNYPQARSYWNIHPAVTNRLDFTTLSRQRKLDLQAMSVFPPELVFDSYEVSLPLWEDVKDGLHYIHFDSFWYFSMHRFLYRILDDFLPKPNVELKS